MNSTVAVTNGNYLISGIQLRERVLIPKWLGRAIIWMFFHRQDSSTTVTISNLHGMPQL